MILVVGSTGSLGGMITRQLLAQGKSVRILVRPSSSYQALVDLGAQPVIGDLKDRPSLDAACQGISTVITTATATQRGGEDTIDSVDLHGNANLIEAARAAGVGQFIFTSGPSPDVNSPVPLVRAKSLTEEHLKSSGMGYTILWPNVFMGVWFGVVIGLALQNRQPVTLVGQGDKRHSFVADPDVAAFAVAAVDHPAAMNQSIPIGGPEPLSWLDVFRIAGDVLGMPLEIRRIPPTEPIPFVPVAAGMGMSGLMALMDTYETPMEMSGIAQTYGVRLTSAQEFLRGMLSGAAH